MNEIYWIQRLDNFYACFEALLIISIVALCILITARWAGDEFSEKTQASIKRWFSIVTCVCSMSSLGLVFMPTTDEALTMYGVGTVIDYVQENETLQELPDKCVKALEAWADSLNEEE